MNNLKKFIDWFFFAPNEERSFFQIIFWWEIRRIFYNLFIGFVGFVSLIFFIYFANVSNKIPQNEDIVEPAMILFAPVAMSVCYTFGEMLELVFGRSWNYNDDVEPWSTALLKFGVGFSLLIVSFPSIFGEFICCC